MATIQINAQYPLLQKYLALFLISIPKNMPTLGDFNSEIHEEAMSEFCEDYNLY